MALITMIRQSDGATMTIDENSPLRTSLKSQGFTEQGAGNQTPPPSSTSSGWVDPANGNPTAAGVGMLKTEWDKQQGGSSSNSNSSSSGNGITLSAEEISRLGSNWASNGKFNFTNVEFSPNGDKVVFSNGLGGAIYISATDPRVQSLAPSFYKGTVTPTPTPTTSTSSLTLASILNDSRVKADQGVNGTTMTQWLNGNSSLIPQLAAKGYTLDDLVNEAYSQVHNNKSAFSGDMTTTTRANNTPNANITPNPITTPGTTTPGQSFDTMIPFRSGLTDTQKQSIITLSQKPVSQWSATDKSNWNWATGSAPFPTEEQQTGTNSEPSTLIPFRSGLSATQKASIETLAKKPVKDWTADDKLNWKWATNDAPMPGSTDTPITEESNSLVPFRPGLSQKQKDDLTLLSKKPAKDWNEEDIANWNWGTNGAARPTAGSAAPNTYDPYSEALKYGYTRDDFANDPGFEAYWKNKTPEQLAAALAQRSDFDATTGMQKGAEAPVETPDLTDLFGSMINLDPFLVEQFKDPAMKAQFDTLDPALKMQYLMNMRALKESIEAGQIVNPNLEITPEQATAFENQAKAKVAGYYDELIGNETGDLKTKLSRMKEDFTTGVGRAEELFKENLSNQAESAAQSGLTFGSQRGEKVSKTIKAQQEGLSDAALEMARTNQDLATQAERRIGSSAFGNLGLDTSAQNYNVGEGGFTQSGTRQLFTPQGNLVGEIPKQREVDVINEKNNLIMAEKQKRILDNSQLNGNPITDWSSVISTPKVATAVTSRPNITLPNGQVISGGDPNYDEYKKQI